MALCLFCKKNEVPLERWNMRCFDCKAKQAEKDKREMQQIDMGIGKRQPAAIIELQDKHGNLTGEKVFVDKFGREVENPGYNLKHDPRGWNFTKANKEQKVIR